jgi:trans-4-hydroxy-L-proline dehydratase
MPQALADRSILPAHLADVSLALADDIADLRDRVLERQRGPQHGCPELALADALAWREHTEGEPWLLWRARRCAARLRAMPVDVEPGERLVGKPRFRPGTEEDTRLLARAREGAAPEPPYPGGDLGHFHPDFPKILRLGAGGVIEEIDARADAPGLTGEQRTFYAATRLVLEAFGDYARNAADACEAVAADGPAGAARWLGQAAICRHIATEPPRTYAEAIQLMSLVIFAMWFAEDHGLTTPGRIDQTLRPFYEADMAAGRITRQEALELIACLYIQGNEILWPGSAISVMVGGVDRDGADVTNDLTYLALAARLATKLVYPTVGVAWHPGTPRELMEFGARMLATGIGCPAFFNDPVIADGLRAHGVSEADCHWYMNSTCVEIKVVGASHMWVTAPYINLPGGMLRAIGRVASGEAGEPAGFDGCLELVREALSADIRGAAESMHATWAHRERWGGCPLASCLIDDCLALGRDFDLGGARYNWVENSFVGLANLVDGLLAIRYLVYEWGEMTLGEFGRILADDYAGHEGLRQRIINAVPKYGTDDDEADAMASHFAAWLIAETESHTVGVHRYVPGFFCWIMHDHMGQQTGATPDGRRAGLPLADGAGAAQGREVCGPTASVLSTTKWDHRPVIGGLVHNAKFSRAALSTEGGLAALRELIGTYMARGGFEIQVNVVGREVLEDAQRHPERYQDLLVRVAGYSDYFVHLSATMQAEVIARSEHEL